LSEFAVLGGLSGPVLGGRSRLLGWVLAHFVLDMHLSGQNISIWFIGLWRRHGK